MRCEPAPGGFGRLARSNVLQSKFASLDPTLKFGHAPRRLVNVAALWIVGSLGRATAAHAPLEDETLMALAQAQTLLERRRRPML